MLAIQVPLISNLAMRMRIALLLRKGVNHVTSFWRKPALVTVLMAITILIICSGLAMAEVVHVAIGSPTAASPVWVRPGSAVQVTGSLAADAEHWINISVTVGTTYTMFGSAVSSLGSGTAFADFSLPAPVPSSDGSYTLLVQASAVGGGGHIEWSSEAGAVKVDGTGPVIGAMTTTSPARTTNATPMWTWTATDGSGCGMDYFIVTLDGEPPIHATGLSFKPSSALVNGSHTLTVRGVDKLGNVGAPVASSAVYVDTAPPAAPAMVPLAAGYNTKPYTVSWSVVTDSPNTIRYEVEYADNAAFSGAMMVPLTITDSSILVYPMAGEEDWFRVRTVSEVSPGEEKRSVWSLPVHTTYDTTPPAKPVLTLVTPGRTNTVPQVWTWSAPSDAVGYKVNVDGAGFVDVGDINIYHTTFNTDGSHSFAVKAYDWLGNESTAAADVVVVDLTPPSLPENFTLSGATPTNDNTPTWLWSHPATWAAENLTGYELRLDGVEIIDVGFVESFTRSDALGDGTYTVEARSYDDLGNRSDWTPAVTVTVDTIPPAAPGMPVTTSPTNNAAPTWTWTHPTPADVVYYDVYVDGQFHTVELNPSYTHEIFAPLGHGMHTLQVAAWDEAGNISERSTPGHVFVDLLAPDVPTINPMPEFSKAGTLSLSWSVSGDDLPVKYNFEWSIDSGLNSTVEPGLTVQSFVVDASSASHGAVVYCTVSAIDAVGNESVPSEAVFTTIDAEAPVVADETAPMQPASNPTPTWEWSATDSDSDVAYFIVTLDGEPPFRTTGTSFTPASALIDGPHRLTIVAVDNVGNESDPLELATITIDTMPPPTPNMPLGDATPSGIVNPTGNRRPRWTWTPKTNPADFDHYNVYLDNQAAVNVGTATTYTPSFDLGHGRHVLQVTSVDNLSNESEKSAQGEVWVDLVAPNVPRMDPMSGFSKAVIITFSWSAADDDLAVTYQFQYRSNGGSWTTVPLALQGQLWPVDARTHANGTVVEGRVRATDEVGNVSGWSDSVSTRIDARGPEITRIEPLEPAPGQPVRTKDTRPTWRWSGIDNFGPIIGSGVSHYIVTLGDEWPLQTTGASFRPSYNLAEGEHVLKVKAVDNVGNVGPEVTFAVVIVDTTAPPAPNMPRANAIGSIIENPTGDSTPRWTWTQAANPDPDGDFDHYNVYLDNFSAVSVGTAREYTPNFPLAHGRHVLQVTSVDDLGNESLKSAQGEVWVDLIAPNAPRANPMPAWSIPKIITFSWSAADDDLAVTYQFQYRGNEDSWITVPLALEGQLWPVDASDYPDGTVLEGRVRAIDAVGNRSGWSAPVSTRIDGTAPVTTFTNPTAAVRSNIPTYTWTWNSIDAGCGTVGYWVRLDAGGAAYQTEPTFTPYILLPGNHTVTVRAVDALGNIEDPVTSAVVTVVEPVMIHVAPSPGAYPINRVSTLTFEVAGMIDGDFEVSIGSQVLTGDPVNGWRVVQIIATEAMSKYYILLDADVLGPGQLLVNVRAGLMTAQYIYDVLNERSGFGFGRLRPW